MSGRRDIVIVRGRAFELPIRFQDAEREAVSLSDYGIVAQYSPKVGHATRVSLGAEFTDASAGEARLYLDGDTTGALTLGTYAWDLLLIDPQGESRGPYLAGRCQVTDSVTEPA